MGVDQSGDRGDAVGIDDVVGALAQTLSDRLHDPIANKNRIRLAQRALQLAGDERADIFYQYRRHDVPNYIKASTGVKPGRVIKKTPMLRCAQSPRVNVLPMYASARRFIARLASESF